MPAEPRRHRDRVDPHRAAPPARSRTASRSTLPLVSIGSAGTTTSSRGAQARGWRSATQSRASSSDEGLDRLEPSERHGDDAVAPLGVRDADDLGGGDGRVLAQPRGDGGGRHVHPAADDHVVDPAEHAEPAVLVEPTGVGGEEPAVHERRAGRRARRRGSRRRGSARRSGSDRPRPARGRTPSSGSPSYTQPPQVSAEPYVATTPHAGLGRARAQRRVDRSAADEHGVELARAPRVPPGTSSQRCSCVGTTDRNAARRRDVREACGRRGPRAGDRPPATGPRR